MMGSITMTMIARGQVVSNASGHYSDAKGVLKWNPAHGILKSDTLIQNHGISTIISPHLITKPRILKYNNYSKNLNKKIKEKSKIIYLLLNLLLSSIITAIK